MPRLPSKWARERVEEMFRQQRGPYGKDVSDSITIANLIDDVREEAMLDAAKLINEGSGKETATLPAARALTVAIQRIRQAAQKGKG